LAAGFLRSSLHLQRSLSAIELGLHNVSASFVPWVGLSLDSFFLQAAMKFLRQHHLLVTYFGVPGFVANSVVLLYAWFADR
jgi:hypothetical protein